MRLPLLSLLSLASAPLVAQSFAIGSTNITFTDPSRGGRQIPCEVYYPATSAGSNVPVAPGAFPVLAFGHGFVMTVGAYANFRDAFVPEGYILVLPTTEGSFLPSHGNFGLDLAFVIGGLQQEGVNIASPFFGHVFPTSAVMGHSMGGGASFLAAGGAPQITTVVNYAAAETNPSAIAAAANASMPTLVFSGSEDCVVPAAGNQQDMYTASASTCKAIVSITGGGHCQFANNNFNCSFGELTCGGPGSISRAAQQDAAQDLTLLWLARYLKDDPAAGAAFTDSLALSTRITGASSFTECPRIAVQLSARLWLDGPYDEGTDLMSDALRVQGLLPAGEPNTAAGFVHVNGAAVGEALDPALLAVTGADAPVDWVFVELRDAGTGATVLATANGLVQCDGDVVAANGGALVFDAPPGEYRIAVRHRNHLGAMTAAAYALTRVPTAVDLGDPLVVTFGTEALRLRDGRALLWAGNAAFGPEVSYTGAGNDRDPILTRVGGTVPTQVVAGYHVEDVNLDGRVKYTGSLNDRDRILITIGGAVPTAVRQEQLP
jgi:predicted dienelactone hydrolase